MAKTRQAPKPRVAPKIIQLVTAHWGRVDKLNSSLYALMDDGRVLQYVPAANPEDAGWKRLNMRPATLAMHQPREDWEADL